VSVTSAIHVKIFIARSRSRVFYKFIPVGSAP
jgi:hypothetical protein